MTTSDFDKACICGRVGDSYALLLCTVDAPIPYTLTVRGKREARKMLQWDAIGETLRLRQVNAEQAKQRREQLAEGRRIEARVRRAGTAR